MYEIITGWFAEAAKGDFFAGGIALGATGTLAALAHGWLLAHADDVAQAQTAAGLIGPRLLAAE